MSVAVLPSLLPFVVAVPSQAAIERQSQAKLDETPKTIPIWAKAPGSKQRFALEFKLGPYVPDVDRNYAGPGFGPYATVFGQTNSLGVTVDEPKPTVMPVLTFEWQFYHFGGPLGLGLQVGYARDRAAAPLADPVPGESARSAADEVTFGVVPLTLLLSYRFELVADHYRVPLVPYFKIGPTYAFWWSRDGSGNISHNGDGDTGSGGVWGLQLNAGGMLRLDFIERRESNHLKESTGIDHTYVFGEYQLSRIDNFGVGRSISVGDSTYFVGLAVEF